MDSPVGSTQVTDDAAGLGHTPRTAALRSRLFQGGGERACPPCPRDIDEMALGESNGGPALRRARAVAAALQRAPAVIEEGQLIVGRQPYSTAPGMRLLQERKITVPKLGYLVPGYATVLRHGLEALRSEAEQRSSALNGGNQAARDFYAGVETVIGAALDYSEKHALLAERLAEDVADATRSAELRELARICRKVPRFPAETMHEALQAVWMTDLVVHAEAAGAAFCFGRMDQYLLPYWREDEREATRELLECFWLQSFWEGHFGGRPFQTLSVGGLRPDGTDGTNPLTYLMLEVSEGLRLTDPSIAVRVHRGSPPELLERSVALLAAGLQQPQFLNDEVMVRGWVENGVALDDARDYSVVGCHEPTIPGRVLNKPAANPGYVAFTDWLFAALRHEPGCQDYEELCHRLRRAMRQTIAERAEVQNRQDGLRAQWMPQPFFSALTADCLERGRDIAAGGARYNFSGFQGIGLGTVTDSLAAVRKLVFEERTVGLDDLRAALESDFEGAEQLRQLLATDAPKYGNDDDRADSIAVELADAFCTEVKRHVTQRGGRFLPALWSVWLNTTLGRVTAATPDGRRAGRPLSHSIGPSLGVALAGPTAAVKSAAKVDQVHAANGSSLLLHLQPDAFATAADRQKVQALVLTYFELGGLQIHFDSTSAEVLEAALERPEEHRDLIVRRAGLSEYFVLLDDDEKRSIISRAKNEP